MLNQFNVSLWGDEAWAATLAVKPIFQIIKIVAHDTSPPLYYLLDHLWMKIFGTGEVSIRTLTFIFFLLTIFFTYLIGKHLWDEKTGLFAAALTFTNPFLFKYAFEGRMYSLLALTTTASMFFYLKKQRLGQIISTTAALYTHHFAIFAVFVQLFWYLVENRKQSFKKLITGLTDFFIIAILYLPWLYPLYYQTTLVKSGFWLGKPGLKQIGELIGIFLVGPGEFNFKFGLRALALVVLAAVFIFRNWSKKIKETGFLLIWFLLPIVLTFAISWIFQPIFYDRYLLFAVPGVLLILASNRRKKSTIFLVTFIGLMLVYNFHYFTHPTKRPFRDFAVLVKEKIDNHDLLINYNAAAHHLFESKYYGLKAPLYVPEGSLPFYVGTALMEKDDLISEIPDSVIRLGVITSGSLEEIKIKGFEKLISFEVEGLKFARFVPGQ